MRVRAVLHVYTCINLAEPIESYNHWSTTEPPKKIVYMSFKDNPM